MATDGAPRMVTEQSLFIYIKPQSSIPALGQFLYLTITVDRSVAKSLIISYEYQNWSQIMIHDGLQINLGLSFSKPKKFSNTDQYKYSFGKSAVISLQWGRGGLFWYLLFWDMDPWTQNQKGMLSRNRSSIISVVLFTITDRRPRQKLFVIFFDQFELI